MAVQTFAAVFTGSRLSLRSAETTAESTAIDHWPLFLPGAGVRPYFPSLSAPRMRGMARRRGACPGLLQSGPMFSRASPDRRALTLMTRASAPLGAPPRHRFRFRVVRRPDPHGASSTPWRLPGGRPGTWLHRPRTQVPRLAHLVRRLGRSAPQSTGLHAQIVKVTHSVKWRNHIFRPAAYARDRQEPSRGRACPGCGATRAHEDRREKSMKRLRSWCTADPGPPKIGTVPGLQRTAVPGLCSILKDSAALRCARDTRP